MINFSSFTDEFVKIAQEAVGEEPVVVPAEEAPKKQLPHPALIAGASLGGLTLGAAGGHLAMEGLDRALKSRTPLPGMAAPAGVPMAVRRLAPVALGLTGLGVAAHQAYTWDKARRAMEERRAQDGGQDT